ncbi:MAG: hypothetical protein LBE09_07400, partial [Christensenellaceae bacterium]|nr:hypothetical protein [Christensenellaceae bacterium]
MFKRLKCKSTLIYVLVIAIICGLALFSMYIASTNVTFALGSDGELSYDYEYIPIQSVALEPVSKQNAVMPGEVVSFGINYTPWYANKTAQSIDFEITTGSLFATISNKGVLSVSDTAQLGETINVIVTVDGIKSLEYPLTIVKIPVSEIIISANTYNVAEGETFDLFSSILPQNASFTELTYEITSGSEYATVNEFATISISGNVRNKNAVFTVQAIGDDGIRSNVLEFPIYVPTKTLNIFADNLTPYSTDSSGSAIKLFSNVSEFATDNCPEYVVNASDMQYIESLVGNVLTIKKGINTGNAEIRVIAKQDGIYSNEITLNIYVPATSITILAQTETISEGQSLPLDIVVSPLYASYASISYQITSGNQHASIKDGVLSINANVSDPKATVSIQVGRDDIVSNILSFNIYVPTKSLALVVDKAIALSTLAAGDTINLFATVSEYATENSPRYVITSGDNYVDNINGNVLTIKNNITISNGSITLHAEQDGLCSNDVVISVYVPVTGITLSSVMTTIKQGGTLNVNTALTPSYASLSDFEYIVVSGKDYVEYFANGVLKIQNIIDIPNASVTIKVMRDGVYSNTLTFGIYVPVTDITLNASKTLAISSSDAGDSIILTPSVDNVATSTPTIIITSGSQYGVLQGNILNVNSGIMVDNAYIDVTAECDDESDTVRIYIKRVRVNAVVIDDPKELSEGEVYQFSAPIITPGNAVNKEYAYSLKGASSFANITSSGILSVNASLSSPNSKITVIATSDGITSNEVEILLIVPVKSLSISSSKTEISSSSTTGEIATLSHSLNFGCVS